MGEGSAATSLDALLRLEDERQDTLRREATRKREAEEAERRRAARDREAAEEADRLARQEAARAEADRAVEARARHRAMEVAAVERERLAAAASSRAAEIELQQRHASEMGKIERDATVVQLRRLLVLVGVVSATVLTGGAGLYAFQIKPAADRAYRQAVGDVVARDLTVRELTARLDAAESGERRVSSELEAARREMGRLRRLPDDRVSTSKSPQPGARPAARRPEGSLETPCHSKDPMCFDLPVVAPAKPP